MRGGWIAPAGGPSAPGEISLGRRIPLPELIQPYRGIESRAAGLS